MIPVTQIGCNTKVTEHNWITTHIKGLYLVVRSEDQEFWSWVRRSNVWCMIRVLSYFIDKNNKTEITMHTIYLMLIVCRVHLFSSYYIHSRLNIPNDPREGGKSKVHCTVFCCFLSLVQLISMNTFIMSTIDKQILLSSLKNFTLKKRNA